MRSIKMMLLLAIAAAVMVAPAAASATQWAEGGTPISEPLQWTKGGATLTEEGSVSFEGPMKFANATLGSIECNTKLSGILNPGATASFWAETILAGTCVLKGALGTNCASVTSASVTGFPFWAAEAVETSGVKAISIGMTAITYQLQAKNKLCPTQLELTGGTVTATPNSSSAISSVSLAGSVGTAGGLGKVSASGTLAASPSGQYGIARPQHVVALSGGIKYSNATYGSIECGLSGSINLRPGEKADITALNWGTCTQAGWMATCGKATAAFKELSSQAVLSGYKISIPKFSFEVQLASCGPWTFAGELIANPNNASSISSTSLEGTLTSPQWGAAKWTGSLSWSPSGKYGIS